MLNAFAKILLTSTAIAPVLLTYAWVAFQSSNCTAALLLVLVCASLVAICLCLLSYARKNLERLNFTAMSVEAADRENIGFLLLYLLPLFTSSFDALNWQIWIPTIIVFGAVVATGFSYHFNPLLGILGWHSYKVGTKEGITYILFTKKQLRSTVNAIEVGLLTEYIVIDLGDN